ncbi:P-type conjugative transfer protein TrbL [Sphingomonas sp. MMSM20]|uniref:P-type conjugative transfer protein TrbL n=1 Tax=Sphingomonas lycopersici TaxID=2951807 RepID=UPI002237479C|nr:P-type conjugative transfer protein TrbL [Sphingomonas lycopersici]MCW6530729.1 P-type conjugative transfer protein TrbL [Sphingomonas lycopersici]
MNDTSVIDRFLEVYGRYIDSGFGLLGGEIGFLSSTLIIIDVTIAGLFWAWGADEDVLQRLIRKTLYIGVFAYIIGHFSNLATILFQSFAGLGLKASGSGLAIGDFMKPGTIAATGLTAAKPLTDAIYLLAGPIGFFVNIVQILILFLAWLIVVLAFFVLAVQIFVTIIEFKLVTLAGFILLPFAFFGRTAFMAERVLGHVISSGIKVLVLAVITGIGTTLFSQFTNSPIATVPDIDQAMTLALAALTLLGLGIFGPSIANGIVTGGPQLGAGAAVGTALGAGAVIGGGAAMAGMTVAGAGGAAGAAALGVARAAGTASGAYGAGAAGKSGGAAVVGGVANIGRAAGNTAASPLRRAAAALRSNFEAGKAAAAGDAVAVPATTGGDGPPAWAKAMKRRQTVSHCASVASHTLKSGDSHGGGAGPDLSQKD